jgi:hypothetical protein
MRVLPPAVRSGLAEEIRLKQTPNNDQCEDGARTSGDSFVKSHSIVRLPPKRTLILRRLLKVFANNITAGNKRFR